MKTLFNNLINKSAFKPNSANVVRCCEKCKQSSLLFTAEIYGNRSDGFFSKEKSGIIEERWTCQNCFYQFNASTEYPNPASIWLFIGLIVFPIGLLGLIMLLFDTSEVAALRNKASDYAMIPITLIFGGIALYYGYRKKTILKRNPIVNYGIEHQFAVLPFEQRKQNLKFDLAPRKCTCGGTLSCAKETKKQFFMFSVGRIYTFTCNSIKDDGTYQKECDNIVKIESIGRSIWLFSISLAIFFIDPFLYEKDLNNLKLWVAYIVVTVIPAISMSIRIKRIYNRFQFPKLKLSLNYNI